MRKKTSGKRENIIEDVDNKGHKQKCHQNGMKQQRHTSEEHRGRRLRTVSSISTAEEPNKSTVKYILFRLSLIYYKIRLMQTI
jgi:hypothetical protein